MPPDESNIFTPQEVKDNIENQLSELIVAKKVTVIIIPDIESVNYGRGVGYDIIEHVPPKKLKKYLLLKLGKNP